MSIKISVKHTKLKQHNSLSISSYGTGNKRRIMTPFYIAHVCIITFAWPTITVRIWPGPCWQLSIFCNIPLQVKKSRKKSEEEKNTQERTLGLVRFELVLKRKSEKNCWKRYCNKGCDMKLRVVDETYILMHHKITIKNYLTAIQKLIRRITKIKTTYKYFCPYAYYSDNLSHINILLSFHHILVVL